jgi:hypothetical protein
MAARYWVGDVVGGDNWSNANAWAAGSGGAGGAGVPGAGDDVYLDVLSLRSCNLDVNTAALLTFDCTGFAQTLTMNARVITVTGATFLLSVGMTFASGTANPCVDLTGVAGTTDLTTGGHQLNGVRFGNGGAGGTYRLQDALDVLLDFDFVRGTFRTNDQNIIVRQDMLWKATLAANSFFAGSSTIEIQRHFTHSISNIMLAAVNYGTSTFRLTGTGNWGAGACSYFNMYLAAPGKTITSNNSFSQYFYGTVTTGSGTVLQIGPGEMQILFSASGQPFQPDPACSMKVRILYNLVAAGSWTVDIPGFAFDGGLSIYMNGPGANPLIYRLLGNTSVGTAGTPKDLITYGTVAAAVYRLDLNGFNLDVHGNVTGVSVAPSFKVDAAAFHVFGYINLSTLVLALDRYYFRVTTGSVTIDGNLNLAVASALYRISLGASGLLTVGGNWNSTGNGTLFTAADQLGVVRFTAAGAFTIAAVVGELWPTVQITAGGTVTLPAGFNCYQLVVPNGHITTGGNVTFRNSYLGGALGSLTVTADVFVGSSFVTTGVTITAGSNIRPTGRVVTLSGFNPATLSMTKEVIRLQLGSSMSIGTLTFEYRLSPGVIQFLAGGTFTVTTLNSLIGWPDSPVQLISSVAGTPWNLVLTAAPSIYNLWPRDCVLTGLALVGDLSNKSLRGNAGAWTLNSDGQARLITDDPGLNSLAASGIGVPQYCWLVSTTLVGLTALATAFAAGAANWHRRTTIPFAVLDNLNIGGHYLVALGLRDDTGAIAAPNVAGGDFVEVTAAGGAGGGAVTKCIVSTKFFG